MLIDRHVPSVGVEIETCGIPVHWGYRLVIYLGGLRMIIFLVLNA